jgi:hypothetical protein
LSGNTGYVNYTGPVFIEGERVLDMTKLGGRGSIVNRYRVLLSDMVASEKVLSDSPQSIESNNASDIDQRKLLQMQDMVHNWGTISVTSTGIERTIGDILTKIMQNIG